MMLFATAPSALFTTEVLEGGSHYIENNLSGLGSNENAARKQVIEDPATIRAISYSSYYHVKVGLVCDVYFFGDDWLLAVRHAVEHADHLVTSWNGVVTLVMHVPQALDNSQIEAAIATVLGAAGGHTLSANFIMEIRRMLATSSNL